MGAPTFDRAIVRILDERGRTRGTGFFISKSGHLLTCHHVIAGLSRITVEGKDGPADARLDEGLSIPDADVAVLRTTAAPAEIVPVELSWQPGAPIWTTGFHDQSAAIRDALPSLGRIAGPTTIAYRASDRSYELKGVLRIEDAKIGPGLSGAPAVLSEHGVAIGIVNTQYKEEGGFVLPFDSPAIQGSKLAEILAENRQLLPRYGAFLNSSGLVKACRRQLERTLGLLENTRQFLPGLYTERRLADEALQGFLGGPFQILPVIGASGVGKTQLLAHTAASLAGDGPVLLVLGYRLSEKQESLGEAVAAELAAAEPGLARTESLAQRIAQILQSSGKRLLIFLDGFNELQVSSPTARRLWLERSTEWLRSAPAKLVISCRPELWEDVKGFLDRDLVHPRPGNEPGPRTDGSGGLDLGDFDSSELETAFEAYEIPPSLRDDPAFHHPLLVRIYWESAVGKGNESTVGRIGYYALFSRFLETKRQKIRERLKSPPPDSFLRLKLENLGHALAHQRGLWIGRKAFYDHFQEALGLAEALLNEHLVVEGAEGFRFALDEVAHYLMAESVRWPEDIDADRWQALRKDFSTLLNIAPFTVSRFEAEGKLEAVRRWLEHMVVSLENRQRALFDEMLLERAFRGLKAPENHFDLLERIAGFYARKGTSGELLDDFLSAWIGGLALEQRLALLRIFVQGEHYYNWETKHWRDLSRAAFEAKNLDWYAAPKWIWKEILSSPEPTLDTLVTWLDDDTLLKESYGVARIYDLASAFLFHACPERLDGVMDRLAEKTLARRSSEASLLLRMIAQRWPDETIEVFDRWVERNDSRYDEIVCDSTGWFLEQGGERAERVGNLILTCFERATSDTMRAKTQSRLAMVPTLRAKVEDSLIRMLHDGNPDVNAWSLIPFLESDFDRIAAELDRYILAKGPGDDSTAAVRVLSSVLHNPEKGPRVLELFENYAGKWEALDSDLAWGAESAFYKVETGSDLAKRLILFALRLFETSGSSSSRRFIIYLATDLNKKDKSRGREILDRILEIEKDSDNLDLLLSIFMGEFKFQEALPWIQAILEKMGSGVGDPWGAVLSKAVSEERFREDLAEWVQVQKEKDLGRLLRDFRRRIEAGIPSREAAFASLVAEVDLIKKKKGERAWS